MLEALKIIADSWPIAAIVAVVVLGLTVAWIFGKVIRFNRRAERLREERNSLLKQTLGRELSYTEKYGD